MTLFELLLVLTIVSLIFGIGLGMLSGLDLGQRAARGLVANVIRSARNTAVASGAPARVRFDRTAQTIRAETERVIGTWHFEEPALSGAFDLSGEMRGGELAPDGFIGRALSFEAVRGSVEVPVQTNPSYDLSLGFSIECAVRTDGTAGVLLDLGGAVGIELSGGGGVTAWFLPVRDGEEDGTDRRGGRLVLETPSRALPAGRWSRLAVRYDGRRFAIEVDGETQAAELLDVRVWKLEGPLRISDANEGARAAIDNLVISAVSADDVVELPGEVVFAEGSPDRIAFAAGGHLDRSVHEGPVQVSVRFADGSEQKIQVGLYGTVE